VINAAAENVNAAHLSGVSFLGNRVGFIFDYFRSFDPRTFGRQLGEQHTIRFYRTARAVRR